MNNRYLIVIEQATDGSYSAYLPDVPGCVSSGDTVEAVKAMIQESLEFHFEGMREAGLPIPPPTRISDYLGVAS